jgi:hypothetical protein
MKRIFYPLFIIAAAGNGPGPVIMSLILLGGMTLVLFKYRQGKVSAR